MAHQTNCKSINVVQWNSNSITNKLSELTDFIREFRIDIVLVCETKLRTNNFCNIKGFACYRKDRPNNPASGGVAIFIKKNIPHNFVPLTTESLEAVAIKIPGNILVASCYNSPSTNINTKDLDHIFRINNKVILAGDLNAKHSFWHCKYANKSGNIMFKYLQTSNADIRFPAAPTRIPMNNTLPSTIDIALVKNIEITKPESMDYLDSDHNPVKFSISKQIFTPITKTNSIQQSKLGGL